MGGQYVEGHAIAGWRIYQVTPKAIADYSILDRPEILMFLFHPRPEPPRSGSASIGEDVLIPVAEGIRIGARLHMAATEAPNILFFHGNGEIVADYDELGPLYTQMGINFLAADYRGYGRSTGQPTVSAMMQDSHIVFQFIKDWLNQNRYSGPFIVMGRSLGSASVLELVDHYKPEIDALIIESGFAFAGPLLQLLGMNPEAMGFSEETGFQNLDKIRNFDRPTLVIHAERDHIIPFSDGQAFYDASPATTKHLLKIPGANHNDIFARGLTQYLEAIKTLVKQV